MASKPEFKQGLVAQQVEEGKPAVFQAQIKGSQRIEIVWSINEETSFQSSSRIKIEKKWNEEGWYEATLTILNCTMEEAGSEVKIQASNAEGWNKSTAILYVIEKPEEEEEDADLAGIIDIITGKRKFNEFFPDVDSDDEHDGEEEAHGDVQDLIRDFLVKAMAETNRASIKEEKTKGSAYMEKHYEEEYQLYIREIEAKKQKTDEHLKKITLKIKKHWSEISELTIQEAELKNQHKMLDLEIEAHMKRKSNVHIHIEKVKKHRKFQYAIAMLMLFILKKDSVFSTFMYSQSYEEMFSSIFSAKAIG